MQNIHSWLSPKDHQSCLSESLLNLLWFQCRESWQQKKKKALASGSAHSSLQSIELKHRQQAREENLAYFYPPLIQVLSVLIYEERLLFTESMKLNFHKNGLSLPAKADQWSSFKTQNGESEAMSVNSSLFSFALTDKQRPQRKRRAEEAPQSYCSVGALVNPFSSQVLKRVPSYYYSSGHNMRCFCELCSPRCRDQRFHLCFMKPFTAELTLYLPGYEYEINNKKGNGGKQSTFQDARDR